MNIYTLEYSKWDKIKKFFCFNVSAKACVINGIISIIHREPSKFITVFHQEILSWKTVRN